MTGPEAFPLWVAVPVALLAVGGAALTLTGSIGLLRLPTFFQRIHAPTLGTTLGMAAILTASMIFFSTIEASPVLAEILIAIFVTATTPVSFILLAKAVRRRKMPPTDADADADTDTDTDALPPAKPEAPAGDVAAREVDR